MSALLLDSHLLRAELLEEAEPFLAGCDDVEPAVAGRSPTGGRPDHHYYVVRKLRKLNDDLAVISRTLGES